MLCIVDMLNIVFFECVKYKGVVKECLGVLCCQYCEQNSSLNVVVQQVWEWVEEEILVMFILLGSEVVVGKQVLVVELLQFDYVLVVLLNWCIDGLMCIVLKGLNGCGKIILLKMLLGLEQVVLGDVWFLVSVVYFD